MLSELLYESLKKFYKDKNEGYIIFQFHTEVNWAKNKKTLFNVKAKLYRFTAFKDLCHKMFFTNVLFVQRQQFLK